MRDHEGREATQNEDSRAGSRKGATQSAAPMPQVMPLQQSIGNAAVVQMLRGAPLRAHRQHQHGMDGDGLPQVQRSAVHDVLRSSGRPLDQATRTDMETRFGEDFSDVRIHDDPAAKASAAGVQARAYTSGTHIVLGHGGTDSHTLAHELTHVVQQRQGPVAGTDNGNGLTISDPSDRYERAAEASATAVMRSRRRTVQRALDDSESSEPPPASEECVPVQRADLPGAAPFADLGQSQEEPGGSHTGAAERLEEELSQSRVASSKQQQGNETLSAVYGEDFFGLRALPQAPYFMPQSFDVRDLPTDKLPALLSRMDLRNLSQPKSEDLDPSNLASSPEAVSSGHYPADGGGQTREVPHVLHQIWFGGPLFDDGEARSDFRETVAKNAKVNAGFTSVLWTDVPRKDFVRAAGADASRSGYLREVANMLDWARESGVTLVNIDELLSAQQLNNRAPEPVGLLAEYARNERLRNVGPGYAGASDADRVVILYLLGGFYSDGDNDITQPLHDFARTLAESREGFSLVRDKKGTDMSAQASFAGNPALFEYIDLLARNSLRELHDLYEEYSPGADLVSNPISTSEETYLRTGQAHEDLPRRLGYERKVSEDGDEITPLSQLLAMGPDLVTMNAAKSWHLVLPRSHDNENWPLAVAQSAVHQMQRDVINRQGVINLSIIADTVNLVPEEQRLDVWRASLRFAAQIPAISGGVTGYSTISPDGRTKPVPAEVVAAARSAFPVATEHLDDSDEFDDADSDMDFGFGAPQPSAAPPPAPAVSTAPGIYAPAPQAAGVPGLPELSGHRPAADARKKKKGLLGRLAKKLGKLAKLFRKKP